MLKYLIVLFLSVTAAAQNPLATVTVDAAANRRAIDPRIYGIAYGSTAQLTGLERSAEPLWRQQQQPLQLAVERRQPGQDWYFESIGIRAAFRGAG